MSEITIVTCLDCTAPATRMFAYDDEEIGIENPFCDAHEPQFGPRPLVCSECDAPAATLYEVDGNLSALCCHDCATRATTRATGSPDRAMPSQHARQGSQGVE